jgi:tetratricopeptide (TPR) repeat protein
VAYETLSRKERKAKHVAAADHLIESWGGDEDEIVEVVASHLLEAYRADPESEDAPDIKARARDTITRAGERAASLAANEEAGRYFVQAAELAEDPVEMAGLLERAGGMAWTGARLEEATDLLERAIALFEGGGETHAAARVSAQLGEITWSAGRIEEAIERMERSFEILSTDEPNSDLASLAAQLGRFLYFEGHEERAAERLERALELAESLGLPEVLSHALNSKGALILMGAKGRPQEGFALLRHALDIALEHEASEATMRAYYNLSNLLYYFDRYEEAAGYVEAGLTLSRKLGGRLWEWNFIAEAVYLAYITGHWEDALLQATDIPRLEESSATRFAAGELVLSTPLILVEQGRPQEASEVLDTYAAFERSADFQERVAYLAAKAVLLHSAGRHDEALVAGLEALDGRSALGTTYPGVKVGFVAAAESALALGNTVRVEELLAMPAGFGAGQTTPYWQAQANRLQARLAAARGDPDAVEPLFEAASGVFREIEAPFWLAVTLTEHGEWLSARGRREGAVPLLAEAEEIFQALNASPWLERVKGVTASTGSSLPG